MIAPDTSQQKGREPQDRTDITFEQERMVELPDVYRTYLQYFQQYAANTDGKQAIAEAVLRLPCAKQMALDLGAGDGRITRHLARHFERVIAVETNPLNEPLLTSIGDNVEVHIRDMRELDFKPFDLAIMAYSFPTDSKGKLEDFIAQLTAHRKKGGFIVAVSYAEGCPWDRYAEFVSKKLGITRTGGSAELIRRIKSVGFESRVILQVPTWIWGKDLIELATNQTFFFLERAPDYIMGICNMLKKLESLAVTLPDGRQAIRVVEDVIGIT